MGHFDQQEPSYALPKYVTDTEIDRPYIGPSFTPIGPLGFPELVFGAATLSTIYNTDALLHSDIPIRTVRLALRYGISAIDTSPYYGDSEVVLGQILRAIAHEFPRSSYKLVTKCGRYGEDVFDYTPATIRQSVMRSLKRLGTNYLDVLYLHDVDFVCSPMHPIPSSGCHATIWDNRDDWGLVPGKEGKIWGTGDRKIVEALAEMRKMKEEGLIRAIGISGYTLPTLLRIALLALHTPPYQPLDVLLSFSHYTLQNSAFAEYIPRFLTEARISQLFCASPLSMGLLTASPPEWHPAPDELKAVTAKALQRVQEWPGGLPNLAIGYTLKREGEVMGGVGREVPTVIGLSNLQEVHDAVMLWREINSLGIDPVPRRYAEGLVKDIYADADLLDWSWASPPFRRKMSQNSGCA